LFGSSFGVVYQRLTGYGVINWTFRMQGERHGSAVESRLCVRQ